MRRSFDNLARSYAALERLAFGDRLQRARSLCLPYAAEAKRALLIGDGDGRFAQALLQANGRVVIDSVDRSAGMLAVAAQRIGTIEKERYRQVHADALQHPYPESNYDFIALHFCLDCFPQPALDRLLPSLERSLSAGGIIAYSDFSDSGRGKWLTRALYGYFRATTDIEARRLPRVAWPASLAREARQEFLGGRVVAEVWRKAAGSANSVASPLAAAGVGRDGTVACASADATKDYRISLG